MQNISETDLQLWQQLKTGQKVAIEKIYYRYIDLLINYGLKFTPELTLVEDAVQDLFVILWNSREKLSDTDSVKNYLMGSLRNNLIRLIQSQAKVSYQDDFNLVPFELVNNIEQDIIQGEKNSERNILLNHSMDQLSNRQKEAIYLKYYEGKEYEEICEIMNINYQSVRNLISTGIKSLKENIQQSR